ncbi:MAG TPA: hypothetical protein DCR23_00060 [Ruminococcaceae bacterium]|nr:hypothetical protein [Oscillospiraceae bacterium]
MNAIDELSEFMIITNFQFPIDKVPYYEELKSWITDYNRRIKKTFIICNSTKERIIDFGNSIIHSLELYKESYEQAFSFFCKSLDDNKDIFPFAYLGKREVYMCLNESYFRINLSEFDYENMLHKPLNLNKNSVRFKSSKYAVSYMSTSPALAWYESKRPEEFYLAEYIVHKYNDETQKLLRLDINPVSAHNEIRNLMCRQNDYKSYINKYLMIFPLIAACSFVVNSKEKENIEEYYISNMLMSWLEEKNEFLGIRYYSDSKDILAKNKGEHNIALFARNPKQNGISKDLIDIFGVNECGTVKHILL